jgi:hypothetical protein
MALFGLPELFLYGYNDVRQFLKRVQMEKIGPWLRWAFIYIFYPIIILAVFVILVTTIVILVKDATDEKGLIRRLTGAVLPVVILVFFVLSDQYDEPLRRSLLLIPIYAHFIVGAMIGIIMIEIGRALWNTTSDAGAASFILFLSLVGVFMVYSFMQGFLGTLNYFLLSTIVAGGLDLIFRD